jgi:hypothetical protein
VNVHGSSSCDGLNISLELGDRLSIADCLSGLGGLLTTRCEAPLAAQIFGAAEALREGLSVTIQAPDRPDYERHLDHLRSQLNTEAMAAAWAQGRRTTLEEAIALVQQSA